MHATKSNCIDHRPVAEFERGVQFTYICLYMINMYTMIHMKDQIKGFRKPYINMAKFNNIKNNMSKI